MDADRRHAGGASPGHAMLESPADRPWVHAACAVLGIWLALAPTTFRYERALAASDVASGLAVAVLSLAAALAPRRHAWTLYLVAAVALWILLAPLVFWTRSPAAYANDTLVGALLIVFSFLVPMGMPMGGPDVPPGWSFNPSSWPQRAPMIALALVGFLISRYLASYQLGHIASAWDPFFGGDGRGTEAVLTSKVSRMFPIPDAGLGSIAYLLEFLSGFMGDRTRWRTMPWMVAMFGLLVVPLGVVSIVLVILQPVAVGTWCTLCLVTAAAMTAMIPQALDEVVAMVQFLRGARGRGETVWHAFWAGGAAPGETESPPAGRAGFRPHAWIRGVAWSWSLAAAAAVGIAILVAPAALPLPRAAAIQATVLGALIAVAAIAALADVGRPARALVVVLGAWLAIVPWAAGAALRPALVLTCLGLLAIGLGLPSGRIAERYGSADRSLGWPTRRHA